MYGRNHLQELAAVQMLISAFRKNFTTFSPFKTFLKSSHKSDCQEYFLQGAEKVAVHKGHKASSVNDQSVKVNVYQTS